MTVDNVQRDFAGNFPAYAFPGGYPLIYLMADGEVICADCANGRNNSEATTDGTLIHELGAQWIIVAQEVHWEGAPEYCAHCNVEIPSAYGEEEGETK